MSRLLFILSLTLISLQSASGAEPVEASLAPYVSCYSSLGPEAQGMKDDQNSIFIRGSRLGSYGVYLVTRSNVYYQPFPLPNSFNEVKEEQDSTIYHYRVEAPGEPIQYISYNDRLGEEPLISRSSEPKAGIKYLNFHTKQGLGVMDNQFRQALHMDLSGKVYALVREYRERENGVTLDEYNGLKSCSEKLPSEDGNRLARIALQNALRALAPSTRPTSLTAGVGLPLGTPRKPAQKTNEKN